MIPFNAGIPAKAGGVIERMRFVKQTAGDGDVPTVAEADANEAILGVSPDASRAHDDDSAAIAGDQVSIVTHGRALITSGGTFVVGAWLKSDANGKAVAAATTGTTVQQHGAKALQASDAEDEKVWVYVQPSPHLPAAA